MVFRLAFYKYKRLSRFKRLRKTITTKMEEFIMPNNEMPRNYQTPETPRNPSGVHQPVVICIDTSGSMRDVPPEGGRRKCDIVQDLINDLANLNLSEYDKENVEICILVFDDDVRVLVDWCSLASFRGDIELDVDGCTALGSAVIRAINKTRERRLAYKAMGIRSKRPQIFVYTDGESTENLDKAYELSQQYLNRKNPAPSTKMYMILIPPAKNPKELAGFGENVTILGVKECKNGLPAAFEFMQGSILAASVSAFGTETTVPINTDELRVKGGNLGHDNEGNVVNIDSVDEPEDDIGDWPSEWNVEE